MLYVGEGGEGGWIEFIPVKVHDIFIFKVKL